MSRDGQLLLLCWSEFNTINVGFIFNQADVSGHYSLIEDEADVDALELTPAQQEKLAVSTQTTLSQWDTQRVIAIIKNRYPQADVHIDICTNTQTRQEAVIAPATSTELYIVDDDTR